MLPAIFNNKTAGWDLFNVVRDDLDLNVVGAGVVFEIAFVDAEE